MKKDKSFVIFAHARSGSNSLVNVLNQHPEIKVMVEPFHEEREKWEEGNKNYKKRVRDISSFNRVLKEIFLEYTGFKTLMYQLPKRYYHYLLEKKGYKTILLYRKNRLKSAVSGEIAQQTNIWTVEEKGKNLPLKKINIPKLKQTMSFQRNMIEEYRKVLKKNDASFLEVSYEELYGSSKRKRIKKVKEIFEFLGFKIPNDDKMKKIGEIVSPKRRISTKRIYRSIPNINEIERKLGSKENGYLFNKEV